MHGFWTARLGCCSRSPVRGGTLFPTIPIPETAMNQSQLDHAVARATGEPLSIVKKFGFELIKVTRRRRHRGHRQRRTRLITRLTRPVG